MVSTSSSLALKQDRELQDQPVVSLGHLGLSSRSVKETKVPENNTVKLHSNKFS